MFLYKSVFKNDIFYLTWGADGINLYEIKRQCIEFTHFRLGESSNKPTRAYCALSSVCVGWPLDFNEKI